jgi:hypothetical protein
MLAQVRNFYRFEALSLIYLKPYHINYLDGTRAPIDVKIIDIN